ncbi:hypothetical protein F2P81_007810 [Scophthalmus maximus]|uniref:Hyaluronan-mediated motility receptor C-terminal domain-containing protein n=1 Tax=Scophthalmus maximus TaxID=52904 RepID=A0A6A4T380_SCOMX|nr:hypothetical protein F2P81_007810 [Scophthalmus maximus]
MSFSRAPLKRFNEHKAPGALLPPPSPSRSLLVSPVRRTMSVDGLVEGSSVKKDKNGVAMERKLQKLLEREIRSLVQQRGEQDRRLLALEDELKNVESKLLATVREKTGLSANVTTLERQRAELKKVNEFLKNKVSADTTKKKINSLTMELMEARNTLDVKSKDLRLALQEKTQESTVGGSHLEKVKQLETELEQHTTDLETARDMLRHREEEAQKLQQELQASKNALWEVEKRLENQEQELKSAQKSVGDMEEQMKLANQEVDDSRATVQQQEAELARLREVLRRTEKELDERVAHLEQRYLFSEEERSRTQEEGLRRVQELKTELNLLQEVKRDEKKKQIQLQQEHDALAEELTKEKALVDSLSVLVEQEREESEERLRQFKEEMEEVLGELAVLEEQEQRKQVVADESQEAVQRLRDENSELERQLSDTRTLLESKSHDVAALKEEHLATTRQLQEAHSNTLSKMGDIVTELESTKEALKGAEERRKELEEEMEGVTQKMKEEMDKVVKQKEEEIKSVKEGLEEHRERQLAEAKAREESARILLEVQTSLVQKDQEMKAVEANHADRITQLQLELQLQTKEKEDALGQLGEQKGQCFTELQNEKETAQKLLQEVGSAKEDIMEQLQQERQERVKIQTALQDNRGAWEVERKDHQQVRSEVLRLQSELEMVDGEKKSLLSQAQLKDQSRLVLENQLNTAEQDKNLLQSRLDDVEQECVSFRAQLDLMEALQCELEEQRQDRRALQEQVEILSQEKLLILTRHSFLLSPPSSETEHWRKQYEELFSKVRPFQEQLNAFAAERNVLLNENGTNQEELNKLADAYARLLGHQNQKQKIKHVMKLKDENVSLKQLKSKLPGAPRRRFDPSKAFQHDKENRHADANEPLKEGKRYSDLMPQHPEPGNLAI